MKEKGKKLTPLQEKVLPLAIACTSSCTATATIQPFDTIKVRMQTRGEKGETKRGLAGMIRDMYRKEGISSFYSGLNAAMGRQFLYGTIRVGVYRYLYSRESQLHQYVPFYKKMMFSITSGLIGSFFGSPFDLVLVRSQADITNPPELRRNYSGVINGLGRITREEGFTTLWKGYSINCVRSATLSSVMLSTNDEIKERINALRKIDKSDMPTNLVAALISGAACSFCSLPFDNVKVKFQKMTPDSSGNMPYKSIPDIFAKTFQREGIRGFWTGYSAFYMRTAPHSMIMLILTDRLHKMFDPNYHL